MKSPAYTAADAAEGTTWSAKRPVTIGILTIVLLIGGFMTWALVTNIGGAIIAPGVIQVEQNRQVVQHLDGGVVSEINVTEAQSVQAGDLLIRLDGSQLKAELAIVEGQLYDSMARRARLEAERDDAEEPIFPADLLTLAQTRTDIAEQIEGQRRLFAARKETQSAQISQLNKRMDQIISQVEGIKAQTDALQDQIALVTPEVTDQQKLLDKGLTQSSRLIDLKREVARLQGNMGELVGNKAQAEGRATEIQLQILQLQSARREEANTQLRDMGDKTLELAERRRALTERVARLDIRAPVSGIVLGLAVTTPNSVLRPAEPVLYIIPQDKPLIIVVQLPPIHVDEVHVGQMVEVVFAAFSARTTPQLQGHLVTISADAMSDQASKQSYYRAEIELEPGELAKLEGQTVIPGMPVQAYISTGDRTPMTYLLKPFTDYLHMAMREN
ncbi:MAG: HlyD family type I secretion periplasmic adaptor subunit [Candidatus Saccharibacteria bacterium]|nr:HlyD family type I secretion periplasmic adaptor subunit [Pseudorhodobacter sp.]